MTLFFLDVICRHISVQATQRMLLPNGKEISVINKDEVAFLYKEIFEDKSYLQHGIDLKPGDTVLDVGANIGLFSLFAATMVGPKVDEDPFLSQSFLQRLQATRISFRVVLIKKYQLYKLYTRPECITCNKKGGFETEHLSEWDRIGHLPIHNSQ